MNLSRIELKGLDSDYLPEVGPPERLNEVFSAFQKRKNSKIIPNKLLKFLYNRYRNFETSEFSGKNKAKILEADVTESVKPHYDKGFKKACKKSARKVRSK